MAIQEVSAGGIVFRRTPSGVAYLLLKYGAGHWDFPKGHVEEGETPLMASKREIHEETGLSPEQQDYIVGFKQKVAYHYRRGQQVVKKDVHFFLVEVQGEKVTISHEHLDYAWLSFAEALEKLTFKTAKDLLRQANRFLEVSGILREERSP